MISKLSFLFISSLVLASTVSSYVVTWTGDDEVTPAHKKLLGQEMCTRGPAYWCYNITQAKECNAVHHCIDKVWQGMTVPEDNDSVCQICLDMVKQARDQLLSNETQDELRQVLEGSCNLIPLKIVAKECRQLADEFIPELVDTLVSQMDPQVVCTVSGLCNSARIDKMLEELKPSKKFDLSVDSCPKCNYYMGKSIDFLKKMPDQELTQKAMMVCGRLGSYSDSCNTMVLAYHDAIYNHLQTQINSEEFCGLVGLCEVTSIRRVNIGQSSTSVRKWTPPTIEDDLPCDFCKQLVKHLKEWLLANTTQNDFTNIIRGICKQTGKFRKECLNLAQEYGKPLYQLLIDETDPDRICGMIGICPNPTKFQLFGKAHDGPLTTILVSPVTFDQAPRLTLKPAEKIAGAEEAAVNNAPRLGLVPAGERLTGDDELTKPLKNKELCEFCELALNEIQNYLESDKTEQAVKNAVEQLCSRLPGEFGDQCRQFLENYSDSVLALLAQEIDPSVICPKIRACPALAATPVPDVRPPLVIKDRRPVGDILPTCSICHFAIDQLIEMIAHNKTKEAIDSAMESVCYILPRTVTDSCIKLMEDYGNTIAEMLLVQGTSRAICFALHLCFWAQHPITTAAPKIIVDSALPFDRFMPAVVIREEIRNISQHHPGLGLEKKVKGGNQCMLCEFAMSKLEERLKDKKTEEEIKEEVKGLCQWMPNRYRTQCQDLIDAYGDMIIEYLANAESPEQICENLGLCDPKGTGAVVEETVVPTVEHDLTMGRCQLCTVIADYLTEILEDPKVETSVDKLAEKVCRFLPKRYASECKEMIEDYGPYLMSLLAQETDKGKACSLLSLCPKKE